MQIIYNNYVSKFNGGFELKKIKKSYENFLEGMGKANEESFGDKKLGCCELNTNKNKNSEQNKNQK